MRWIAAIAGCVIGVFAVAPKAVAACLPIDPVSQRACIKYEGYASRSSTQGKKHSHYFSNTCRKNVRITYEWVNARPRKWKHVALRPGKQGVSCLNGVCPGPLIWAPVCSDGSVGTSSLARSAAAGNRLPARRNATVRVSQTPLDRKIIGTWDYKNRHDCPRHTMRCTGRYDFKSKKKSNQYVFRGVISCRRDIKPGVKATLKNDTTFTTYFNEIWTVNGNELVATSQVTAKNKNVSSTTLRSRLRGNEFSGIGPSCRGKGTQKWTATKRS